MLTKSEIDWLRCRSMAPNLYCGWCMKYALCCNPQFNRCPIKDSDWQEAAIFEASVAAKLAETWEDAPSAEAMTEAYIHGNSIAWALLKIASLQVEEEMDAD